MLFLFLGRTVDVFNYSKQSFIKIAVNEIRLINLEQLFVLDLIEMNTLFVDLVLHIVCSITNHLIQLIKSELFATMLNRNVSNNKTISIRVIHMSLREFLVDVKVK